MNERQTTIAIVAPSRSISVEVADRVRAIAAELYAGDVALQFADQCFRNHGHFAGDDEERANALVAAANDPAVDAIWFARGGYGAGRIVDLVVDRLDDDAGHKRYLGYSDGGYVLASLYARGFPNLAHGPMAIDASRPGGETAIIRALRHLVDNDPKVREPNSGGDVRAIAFNITVLAHLVARNDFPDLTGHVLMLEDVDEYHYALDRSLGAIFTSRATAGLKGVRLGRCSLKPNVEKRDGVVSTIDFGASAEDMVAHWCARAGVAFLGEADIGHDADNKVVPFGFAR